MTAAAAVNGSELLARKVSLYANTKDTTGKPVTLATIADGIRGGTWRGMIETLRAESDEAKQKALKAALPGFCAAGVFSRRNKVSITDPSGLLIVDIDDLGSMDRAAEVRDMLADDPHVLLAFVSCRGEGVKLLVYAGEISTDAEFKAAWRAFAEYAAETYNLTLDPSGKDLARLCFISADPGACLNVGEIEPFLARSEIVKPEKAATPELPPAAAPGDLGEIVPATPDAPPVANVRAALCHLDPGVEYGQWLRIGMAIKSAYPGADGFNLFDEWSRRAPAGRYGGTAEAWRSIKGEGGVTVGTLYAAAEAAGWVNPTGKVYAEIRRARADEPDSIADEPDPAAFVPFPVECFPGAVQDYVCTVAESNCVDPCAPALAALVVAGAAMGNAFRLRLKKGFVVPPLLWGCVVGRTGTNKTAPMREVVEPLREIRPEVNSENPDKMALLCPQSRAVIGDATSAAVIHRLSEAPRGLLSFRDELAAWVKEFDAYKKGAGGGGDEQFWLKAWDADHYQLDRKTDKEHKEIHAAAVSILGGMQPAVLAGCFDAGKYASGLVPRLLPVYPPERPMRWTETEISDEARGIWKRIVQALRFVPFDAFKPSGADYEPNVVKLSSGAYESFKTYYNALGVEIDSMDDFHRMFASKARVMAARIALILYGMESVTGRGDWSAPVSLPTMDAAETMGRWFLNEQWRVYGFATVRHDRKRDEDVMEWIRRKGGRTTARDLQRAHNKRYRSAELAKADLQRLVESGKGRWVGHDFVMGG